MIEKETITKEEYDKLLNLKNNYLDNIQEGDRIFVSDSCKNFKKRDLDKYLKANYENVKRVSKIEDSNIALDDNSIYNVDFNRYYNVGYGFNNFVHYRDSQSIYNYLEEYYNISQQETDNIFEQEINTIFDNCNYVRDPVYLEENYPNVFHSKYELFIDSKGSHLVKSLDNVRVYHYKDVMETVDNFIQDSKECTEDIDFENIEAMLLSTEDNAKVAITMLKGFDITKVSYKILCAYFNPKVNHKSKLLIKRYMIKEPIFNTCTLGVCGNKESDLHRSGFYKLKTSLKRLEKKGIEIDYNYVTKKLFEL